MSNLSITTAGVVAAAGGRIRRGTAGAAVSAGQVVFRDMTDSTFKLADSDSVTPAVRMPRAIALNGAFDGQPLAVHERGPLAIGATLVPGATYFLSSTPGGICPESDLAEGEYATIVGVALSDSVLDVEFQVSGVPYGGTPTPTPTPSGTPMGLLLALTTAS